MIDANTNVNADHLKSRTVGFIHRLHRNYEMSSLFEVQLFPSKAGRKPIACVKVNENEKNTFFYARCGRKGASFVYYTCIQCKKVDRKTAGCKQIHVVNGTTVVNGNPTLGHKIGCKPLQAEQVYVESHKRHASQQVRQGSANVGNARLNNHAAMIAGCKDAGVSTEKSRKLWNVKTMNARLSYNKCSRVSPLSLTGELPQELKVLVCFQVGRRRGLV